MPPRGEPGLDTPALVIDLDALERNLRRMAAFFAPLPCALRPHAKTHKCVEIARRQIELGAVGITCAKLGEAETMADGGIADVLIANQVTAPGKLPRLARLAGRCTLTVAIDDLENANAIAAAAREAGTTVGVLVEVDTGMGRCGIAPEPAAGARFCRTVAELDGLRFRGLMGYEGHAVLVEDRAERQATAETAARLLLECASAVRDAGLPVEIVSAGGTGTYDATGRLDGITEIQAGSFVSAGGTGTYDATGRLDGITEIQAGSYCLMDARYRRVRPEFDNALFLLATVVSRPTAERVVLDCGMKSITHEFGLPIVLDPPGLELVHLSEEHGACRVAQPPCALRPGDRVRLLPTHCCTTVNLHDRYWVVRDGLLVETWPIAARGRFD